MCGLAGVAGLPLELARPAAERMQAALRHRGPDAEGLAVVEGRAGLPPVVLAHTRLSIVDLSPTGRQPMSADPDDPLAPWIVFNGEAYEAPELRGSLARLGRRCRGTSDTEALVQGYQAWGQRLYEHVRGMFAWALADPAAGRIVLARDRLGIKPLYTYRPAGGGLLFASEVRALLAAGPDLVPARLEPRAVEAFLSQGAVFSERALIAGVELVPAGAELLCDWEGRPLERRQAWSLPSLSSPPRTTDRREAARLVGQTLRRALEQHLRADVPVGLFLSGGIDSATLATLTSEGGRHPTTLSIGFDQPEWDESETAAQIARQLGTQHVSRRLTGGEVRDSFDEVLAAADQPTVDGFNTWFVSREARRAGLKVVLSGVGGDELFAGYDSFRDVPRARRLRRLLGRRGSRRLGRLGRFARGRYGRAGVKLEQLGRRSPSLLELYLLRRELWLPEDRLRLFPTGGAQGPPEEVLAPLRSLEHGPPLGVLSRLELSLYLRHMLLRDGDAFSMAHGLELRVPLLDHELVELVLPLPDRLKARRRGGPPKPLLVEAAGPRLPKVACGPKRGFSFPWDAWLRGALAERFREACAARPLWQSLGFDDREVYDVGRRFREGDPRVSGSAALSLIVLNDYARRHKVTG
jgi:asparagine synthase (glutamine-hydrolysing)